MEHIEQTRRQFLTGSIILGSSAWRAQSRISGRVPEVQRAPKPLRLLFLGGTGFLGPHQVEYALRRGHRVTLFNRGRTNPHLFPEIEKLRGDRNDNLEALKSRNGRV